MKRHLLAITAAMMMSQAYAQVQVGAKFGVNLAHISTNQTSIDNHKKVWPTLQGGLMVDIAASENFSVQPHLVFQGKGTEWDNGTIHTKYRFFSMDIPVNLLYRSNGFFIGGGPNFGFNLDANAKTDGEVTDITIGSGDDDVRGFDFGVNFMAGYQADFGLVVGVNYLRGITNLDQTPDADWRNHVFGITVGFLLGNRNAGKKD